MVHKGYKHASQACSVNFDLNFKSFKPNMEIWLLWTKQYGLEITVQSTSHSTPIIS